MNFIISMLSRVSSYSYNKEKRQTFKKKLIKEETKHPLNHRINARGRHEQRNAMGAYPWNWREDDSVFNPAKRRSKNSYFHKGKGSSGFAKHNSLFTTIGV
jgi:hypothetical protein